MFSTEKVSVTPLAPEALGLNEYWLPATTLVAGVPVMEGGATLWVFVEDAESLPPPPQPAAKIATAAHKKKRANGAALKRCT